MPTYKLAAFDMDGTLLNSGKEISDSARSALIRANEAGSVLALDTGRAISELTIYPLGEMGIRYGSCACGTVIYDFLAGKVLAMRTIPTNLVPVLIEASRKEKIMLQVMIDGVSHVEGADVKNMPQFGIGVYQPLFEVASVFTEDIRTFTLERSDRINKINMYHTSPECRSRTQARLSGLELDFTFAETTSLEITPQGVSKGTGLADLCNVLDIPIEEAIGVGDAFNDIPMLKAAGLGVAMGNSNKEAIEAADVVVGDNDHDGIAEVIDRYLLGHN